jgi:pimeloyl-ACP methyl ester carboxylesterase
MVTASRVTPSRPVPTERGRMTKLAQTPVGTTEKVRSADGTPIAVDRSGNGPPLVVVVGAFCDRSTTRPLAALLESSYTVYAYDRRGRGDSGDAETYAVEREVEDLEAVVAKTGVAPYVYGHSSGGALALEAAARGRNMRKIAVYEPPYAGDDPRLPGFGDKLDDLVRSGRRGEAAESFLALAGAPPEVIEHIKASPGWDGMVALAHTLSRDIALANGGAVPVDRIATVGAPTLAMAGGESYGWAHHAARTIASTIPGAQARIVKGQQHAPAHEVVASILKEFFA